MDVVYSLAGFVVGFIIGLTGVGGGSLMTPILVLIFSIKPAIAVGTDLLYAAITKSGGIFVHHHQQTINWKIVGLLSIGSIPSSLAALFLLQKFESTGIDYDRLISLVLSIALILTSSVLLFKNRLQVASQNERFNSIRALHLRFRPPMTILSGVLIGALVTISSVGAGAIGAAILFFLYPRLRTVTIVGTDLAHAVPITAIAGIGHAHIGTVDYNLLLSLIIGSLPGIYLGSKTGAIVPDKIIRPLLAIMLMVIGVFMAIKN
ncbi:MAG: putative membrane protein YfcA [Gammaproteobacteria bacterium]|jgi:uncharacterized membrane protein YfcA